jgi:hypothetical protein
VFIRLLAENVVGGFLPDLRKPIFSGVESAAWWARMLPLLLISVLVAIGAMVWLYERARGRRIRI